MLERWISWTKADIWHSRWLGLAVFTIWLCLVLILVRHHAFWRDEVRVLSLATRGDLISMIESLRGEGHPALWFLLVRYAYYLVGSSAVLWIVSVGVASGAALLLVLRSPFGWPLIALFLFGRVALFEYSVMARNYGISMLLMFLFAACYQRYRDRSLVLGGVLFLLANTNAHSLILVGAFSLFWFIDVLSRREFQWGAPLRTFLLNFAIALIGVLAAFSTIYPPFADAIPIGIEKGVELKQIALAVFEPARTFGELTRVYSWEVMGFGWLGNVTMSLVLFGSIFGLVRSRGAFLAALAALIGFSLFFTLVYPGYYRHQALWLVFLLSMYWIARELEVSSDQFQQVYKPILRTRMVGSTLMVLLVTMQLMGGFRAVADAIFDGVPQSRSRDFSYFLQGQRSLKQAIIIADPDYLLEALPYYIDNPTYLMRDQRFGNVVTFTNKALVDLNLDDILNVAKKLNRERGKPIVILLAQRLNPDLAAKSYHEGYNWTLSITPDQSRRFLASTQILVQFGPAKLDESFDAYLFDQQ